MLVEMSIQHDPTVMPTMNMHDNKMHDSSGYMHDRFTFNTAMHGKWSVE